MSNKLQQLKRILHPLLPMIALPLVAFGMVAIAGVVFFQIGRHSQTSTEAEKSDVKFWTCSMHPNVQRQESGSCPICFMDLIPVSASSINDAHPRRLELSPEAAGLADIRTTKVQRRFVTHQIDLDGKVAYDETKLSYITAWVPGRIDRMFIDYTGVSVRSGDHLVSLFSAALVEDQKSLLQMWKALKSKPNDEFYIRNLKSAEDRLRLQGLLPEQIEQIKLQETPSEHVTIYSPSTGVVIEKHANEGMYVEQGTRLYTIADLNLVWVFMDAYESDVAWLKYGQEVEFSTESFPGEIFNGRIAFIDRILNETTRTFRVRVNVGNEDGRLKPGMFVRAQVHSQLAGGGQVIDESMAGKWVSPHHPEIIRDEPGLCPICGIALLPAEEMGFVLETPSLQPPLVIPATAPLLTGKRAVVYVQVASEKQPTFEGRDVLLGKRAGDHYIVLHGLEEGESVVTSGNFKIDSSLQILGKPSMMNPEVGIPAAGQTLKRGDSVREPLAVSAHFRTSLNPLYAGYLTASDALAKDDLGQARVGLQQVIDALSKIKLEQLDAEARSHWTPLADAVAFNTHDALQAKDRIQTRNKFHQVSNTMVEILYLFGHALDSSLHQFHCPMAMNNQGGQWLQRTPSTLNPYFGAAMLECGESTAVFHSQAKLVATDAFSTGLSQLLQHYLELQTELAADQRAKAGQAAVSLKAVVGTMDPTGLDKRATDAWAVAQLRLTTELNDVERTPMDIEKLRARFEAISLTLLELVDRFGHSTNQSLYKAYCPMAFNDKGAIWLQQGTTIANPYFGAKMLRCGSIKQTFESELVTEGSK